MAVNRAVSSHFMVNQRTLWANPSPCHGPEPAARGYTNPDDRRAVDERQDAGALHRAPSRGPGRGGQVLPGERGGRVPPFLLLLVKEEMWPARPTRTIHHPGKR